MQPFPFQNSSPKAFTTVHKKETKKEGKKSNKKSYTKSEHTMQISKGLL